ncbi:hypothetical protein TIFTF001_010100 [Ficus carica]|uniref:Uncharacterized protein n=1 Tax=Ficus carica TaxID=3494 RepID=A0AA88D352_FICCA|nr:hypothetical protein TIFTF001_010100 [Ficus carica]
MIRSLYLLLQFVFLFALSEAQLSIIQPQAAKSFNISQIQNVGSCSYNVIITTSCSSPAYTRDEISISFGDAYGNQIYAPRLDDPSTRAFERCSSDSYQINGPCAYQICYVYLYRTGPDGWKPETVKIYAYNSKAVTFYYNTFIPADTWYGFDLCGGAVSMSHQRFGPSWFSVIIVLFLLFL